jgi:hypothetical protein
VSPIVHSIHVGISVIVQRYPRHGPSLKTGLPFPDLRVLYGTRAKTRLTW